MYILGLLVLVLMWFLSVQTCISAPICASCTFSLVLFLVGCFVIFIFDSSHFIIIS